MTRKKLLGMVLLATAAMWTGSDSLYAAPLQQYAQAGPSRDRPGQRPQRQAPQPGPRSGPPPSQRPSSRPMPPRQPSMRQAPQPGPRSTPLPSGRRSTPPVPPRPRPSARPPAPSQRWDWNSYRPGVVPPLWPRYRNTFNPRLYQRNYRALNRYRGPAYLPPAGWYYRRWVFGQILPSFFWSRNYWIFDYWLYGLMDPPYGFVWVRYGDDAILVDVHSGIILRVVYNVFF